MKINGLIWILVVILMIVVGGVSLNQYRQEIETQRIQEEARRRERVEEAQTRKIYLVHEIDKEFEDSLALAVHNHVGKIRRVRGTVGRMQLDDGSIGREYRNRKDYSDRRYILRLYEDSDIGTFKMICVGLPESDATGIKTGSSVLVKGKILHSASWDSYVVIDECRIST